MALCHLLMMISLLTGFAVGGTFLCPPPCDCTPAFYADSQLLAINCNGKGLTVIPDFESLRGERLFKIDLSDNDISVVRGNAFNDLDFFSYNIAHHPKIYLHNNRIEQVDDDAFSGINADRFELFMSNSSIDEFPSVAISQIQNLSSLYIGDNSITVVPPNSFVDFIKLRTLFLDGNPLGELDENAFQGLEDTLEYLYLKRAELVEFPTQAIKLLRELRLVNLEGNALEYLYSPLFEGFEERSTAFTVDFTRCDIHNITATALADDGVGVLSLVLRQNHLTQVDFLRSACESALLPYAKIYVDDNPIECTCETLSLLKQLPSVMNVHGHCSGPSAFDDMELFTIIHDRDVDIMEQECPHLYANGRFIQPQMVCDRQVALAQGLHSIGAAFCPLLALAVYMVV